MTLGQGNLLYNRYRVLETLGRGGMGAVYRATDESLGVEVAVKENLFTTDDYARQFRMEAVILAGIRHPNLPRVTDHFVIEDMGQYLVMDYIEGDDLRQRMEKDGPISEAEAVRIGTAACDALAYLHSRKPPILHRDIKLGNIKLSRDGNIYLVDFGLAKMAWEHEETMTGARAMTPGYSPPEQYGSARTDARSDIYSLGATLYAAVTGVIPEDSLMRAADGLLLTPVRDHRPEISLRLASVIEKALEIIPANRYQTADEFKRALIGSASSEELVENQAIGRQTQPPPPSPVELVPPLATAPKQDFSWGRLLFVILLFLSIVVGVVWINPYYRDWVLARFMPVSVTQVSSPVSPASPAYLSPGSPEPAVTTGLFTPTSGLPTPSSKATLTVASMAASPSVVTPSPLETPTPLATQQGGGTGEIAFASLKDNVAQIFLVNADGTNLRQLTRDLNGACNFDWSPDGSQIVYTSPCAGKSLQYPDSALYRFDLEKGATSLLFSNPKGDFEPAWSPDGTQILFTSMRDGSMQVYIYNLETGSLTPLTFPGNNMQARYPAWSPDGMQIAYTVRRFGLLQIWGMDVDGNNRQQLARPGGSVSNFLPAWSPDGQYLFFSETNSELTAPASLMKLMLGETLAKIVAIQRPVVDVDFSADGQWIAYETSDAINQDIFVYNLTSGSAPRPLTKSGTINFDPAWRPGK